MDSRAYHRNQNAEERTRKTLVTAAPKYGATAEIAQAIADALRDYGLDPTVRTSKSSTSRPPHRSRISCNTTTPGHGPSAEDLATYAGSSPHGAAILTSAMCPPAFRSDRGCPRHPLRLVSLFQARLAGTGAKRA
jgi:hypothetical protein